MHAGGWSINLIFAYFVLAVADVVTDLSVEIMMLNLQEFILQVSWKVMQMKSNVFMIFF